MIILIPSIQNMPYFEASKFKQAVEDTRVHIYQAHISIINQIVHAAYQELACQNQGDRSKLHFSIMGTEVTH